MTTSPTDSGTWSRTRPEGRILIPCEISFGATPNGFLGPDSGHGTRFLGEPAPPSDPPASAAVLFGDLLDRLGFPSSHPQTPFLARSFVHAVGYAGGLEEAEEILTRFDASTRFDDDDLTENEDPDNKPGPP